MSKKQVIVIFIGPPGSGKGTQAKLLADKFNYTDLSSGKLFREEVQKKTKIGKQIKPFMDKGFLVSDEITTEMMIKKISRLRKPIILDGFPRNLNQSKILDEYLQKHKNKYKIVIVEVKLTEKQVSQRILGRLECACGRIFHEQLNLPSNKGICDICGSKLQTRSDAKVSVVKTRMQIYKYETAPILKFYKKEKYYRFYQVEGDKKVNEVFKQLEKIIKRSK
ncbi:nucleoside monophosphate kinase [Candidatus Falkowbacteria bacterium]|jgi:adenylate kinase|nr:nucleoside monophosphate kinase [Candidatus Falkowbacteria bacterium]MBT5503007.1 nucleoside monophosphate kinase [Candidatus Falkowbacteria bacterium]MBT6574363.1 nucleoside monophosphate kinase [Candidatus Falkowbacteria bacterium]MBT7349044.1 nucleoside monophosphate kinase [Candidatus Falkowbacteria bacterium]MBT7500962.1 nucleoside monophosphate kinase [Candidatus Falkowbacteria bacterium]